MNLPRKGCPGTQHRLMTSATNFSHRLDCSFLSWHLVESKGTLSPGQMSGLYFGPANCLTFEQCSVMTEILSPRAKIFTSNERMKTVATSLCSEYRGSKLLIIQEILDSFGFLHESVLDSKKPWSSAQVVEKVLARNPNSRIRSPRPLSHNLIQGQCRLRTTAPWSATWGW